MMAPEPEPEPMSTSASTITLETEQPQDDKQVVFTATSPSTVLLPEWKESELMLTEVDQPVFEDHDEKRNSYISCSDPLEELEMLKLLAVTRTGLINKELRAKAWPKFISYENDEDEESLIAFNEKLSNWQGLPHHKDEDQVSKDVDRSFVYYPKDITGEDLSILRERLQNLIVRMLRTVPNLNYYQGYHDIVSIIVLIFDDDETAFEFLYKLTLIYLRDHMLPNIESSVKQLQLIPELISDLDYTLYKIIGTIQPVYALSSIISLFAHDLNKFDDLCLVWDFVFVHNDPSLIIYIYATLLFYYRDDILTDLDEISGKSFSSDDTLTNSGVEFDDSYVSEFYNSDLIHVTLTNLIKNNLNSTNSIDSNLEIYNILQMSIKNKYDYPLTSLKSLQNLSKYSSLRTNSKVSIQLLDLQIKEQKEEVEKLRKEQELEYERRLQHQKQKQQKQQNQHQKKTKSNQLILRFKKLSLVLKISVGIGILGIAMNYALHNTQFGHSIRNKLVGLCSNQFSIPGNNGENLIISMIDTVFGKHSQQHYAK